MSIAQVQITTQALSRLSPAAAALAVDRATQATYSQTLLIPVIGTPEPIADELTEVFGQPTGDGETYWRVRGADVAEV